MALDSVTDTPESSSVAASPSTTANPTGTDGLPDLLSSKSTRRLEQIAGLRARGIGDHISLPQLVVCGDQSAGKSSVLEGITGIPFPRQDGLCTRFATEIILRHTNNSTGDMEIAAAVLPASTRSEKSKTQIRAYSRRLKNFDQLPKTIEEAGLLMGVRGFGDIRVGPAFVEDVLRIEVSGPTGLHLTVVDLPGLIANPSEEQCDEDVDTVHALVDSYVANPRTITLAVVQAGNDIANQPIIQKSRRHDKAGERTVGIITKPDLINEGTESRIALLAKNQDTTRLNLGYFIVKNPTPIELKSGITPQKREANEKAFFTSSPWKEQALEEDRVGIAALKTYLQALLDRHIERELPHVREEIRNLFQKNEEHILALGDERPTAAHRRTFLSRLSMRFHVLALSALNGTYHEVDAVFFSGPNLDDSTRLRAVVHSLNTRFSTHMRERGEKRKIKPAQIGQGSDGKANDAKDDDEDNPQLLVNESEMKSWVKKIYMNSRGKELPGNYNHILLSELFYEQSSRWRDIAEDHVENMCDEIDLFVTTALSHMVRDEQVLAEITEIAGSTLRKNRKLAANELRKLVYDEKQQPITYNHYYTDNIQKSRQDFTRGQIQKAINDTKEQDGKLHVSNVQVDAEKLIASLQSRIVVDMDNQACTEALAGLQAYYKVARKTFVDNVCRQVIERHLLRDLPSIFCPEIVAEMSEDELERIAAERPANVRKRKELQELQAQLRESLHDLRR